MNGRLGLVILVLEALGAQQLQEGAEPRQLIADLAGKELQVGHCVGNLLFSRRAVFQHLPVCQRVSESVAAATEDESNNLATRS